jgi:Tol biopolymer transport system component
VDQDIFPVPTTIEGPFLLDLRTGEQTAVEQTALADLYNLGSVYVAASPDGTRLYANSCCSSIDLSKLVNLDGSDERILDPEGSVGYLNGRWSPDGTKIVYQAKDMAFITQFGSLIVEDVASGEQTQVIDFERDFGRESAWWFFITPTFSGDGQHVYFHLPRGGEEENPEWDVWSVPVTGGEPTMVLENAAQPVTLPDQESLGAFVVPGPDDFSGPSLMLSTREGPRTLVEAREMIGAPTASPDGTRIAYFDGDTEIYVVDVSTGESAQVAQADDVLSWIDNDTLILDSP